MTEPEGSTFPASTDGIKMISWLSENQVADGTFREADRHVANEPIRLWIIMIKRKPIGA